MSGGVWGLERGYCMMAGGEKKAFDYIEPALISLAPGKLAALETKNRTQEYSSASSGYYYCGPSGSGHFVKMIHNAIEYGIMQSYAEGLELLKNANVEHLPQSQRNDLDIREITELWRRGSVVGSWLLDLMSLALHHDKDLSGFSGVVPDSGEGRWALMEAIKQNTPAPNLANSLLRVLDPDKGNSFAERALSALRKEFGATAKMPDQNKCYIGTAAKPAPDCVMVIFGAGGDLTNRLLLPTICHLGGDGLLPANFNLVGVAGLDITTKVFVTICYTT